MQSYYKKYNVIKKISITIKNLFINTGILWIKIFVFTINIISLLNIEKIY